jgi:antirestriction protein ArdC
MLPYNALTQKPYVGNASLKCIALSGYTTPQWAGYNQWQELGRVVKKGEKATRVMLPLVCGDSKTVQKFKTVFIFNIDQTEVMEKGE